MSESIKDTVRSKYGAIAVTPGSGCCGPAAPTAAETGATGVVRNSACCGAPTAAPISYSMVGELYSPLAGYEADADLGLGCGQPTRYAHLQPGETVLDLGSGAGNDVFVARAEVGELGRVIGLDMTPEMVDRARTIAAARGFSNVEFVLGDIESMPLPNATIDCVLSNCVLNLVPDKPAAFAEIFRVLKPGGRFSVSDIVVTRPLPEAVRRSAELYVGCVAGALERDRYLELIAAAGFEEVRVVAERTIDLPREVLEAALSAEEIARLHDSGTHVVSVTVNAVRPR